MFDLGVEAAQIRSNRSPGLTSNLKTNDGYIASSLKIEQKMGVCHHLSNCFDNLSRSSNIMEYNRLYLDCPGP